MSKKCCGFIYSDEEQICRICGSELVHEAEPVVTVKDEQVDNVQNDIQSELDNFDMDKIMASVSNIQTQIESELAEPIGDEPKSEAEEVSLVSEEIEDKNMMDILDEVVEDHVANDNAKIKPGEEKATTGIKVVGILSIILAVLGIAMVGVCIYFMVIKPSYDKSGESNKQLYYPEIATNSDIEFAAPRDYISLIPLATGTDAIYTPVNPDIEETDTTVTDATASDADETTEADAVE